MKNQTSAFVIFCLGLTVFMLSAYTVFTRHFNGSKQYEHQISSLEESVEKEKFKNDLMAFQMKDFQQTVAQMIPENDRIANNDKLKNFASSLRTPASTLTIDLSAALYEKGKKFYGNKEYEKAIKEFRKLTEQYPLSEYNVESRFFIAESYFKKKDYKSSLAMIDEMVNLYPDNDLTGFILLRMGQISEINNQYEEASEIYRTVEKNFRNDKIQQQARQLANTLDY